MRLVISAAVAIALLLLRRLRFQHRAGLSATTHANPDRGHFAAQAEEDRGRGSGVNNGGLFRGYARRTERRTLPRSDRNRRGRAHHFSARHFNGRPKSYLPRAAIAACVCARSVFTIPEFPAAASAATYWSSSTSARCGSPSRNAVIAAVIK